MKEANQKYAILEDVDGDTMAPFIEYLYTKDYTVPDPQIVLNIPDSVSVAEESVLETGLKFTDADEHDEAEPENVVEPEVSWGFALTSTPKVKKKKRVKTNPWHEDPREIPPADTGPYECKKDRVRGSSRSCSATSGE